MSARPPSAWQRAAEAGSIGAMRAMNLLYRLLGRRVCLWVLHPIVAWFALREGEARRASLDYQATLRAFPGGAAALGSLSPRAGFRRHLHEFATQIFDRMVVWGDSLTRMDVDPEGGRPLLELARAGRGGILVGAHLGSFDLLRRVADRYDVVVHVLMYTDHAAQINAFFERLDPRSRVRVLRIDPDFVSTVFAIRRCVERGEFVGILADRLHAGGRERPRRVPFLGRPAAFPTTPFAVAATLGCPLVLCTCVRTGDAAYASIARVLRDGPPVARREREKAVGELVDAYVGELERWCLRAPWQWFNFYEFWGDDLRLDGSDG